MNKRIRKKKGLSKITAEEVWSLDMTLAKYILPRLMKYKEINTMSYPCGFKSVEEWHNVIDKMIFSFDWFLSYHGKAKYKTIEEYKRDENKYKEGMNLFSEYFSDLWD